MNKVAFVFPGQGVQSLRMLASFKSGFPEIQAIFKEASHVLDYDLWRLAQEGPIDLMNQTRYTQPLLLTIGVALWQLWKSRGGVLPDWLLGHSLGEYTAYTCAESFSFEEALRLVAQRGLYMQEAVSNIECAMAVIVGLSYQTVAAVCNQQKDNQIVSPSNYNAPDQVVVAGHYHAVKRVMAEAKQKGARWVKQLSISVPAHCDLMRPATDKLEQALTQVTIKIPNIPVVSNTYFKALSDTAMIQKSLVSQLYQPVNWVHHIHFLLEQGVNVFVECGPNQVLAGFIRRIAQGRVKILSIGNYEAFQQAVLEC